MSDKREELDGFDLELTSFDCRYQWVERWDREPWSCPFQPGCGAKRASDCAAAKQYYQICRAPERAQ